VPKKKVNLDELTQEIETKAHIAVGARQSLWDRWPDELKQVVEVILTKRDNGSCGMFSASYTAAWLSKKFGLKITGQQLCRYAQHVLGRRGWKTKE
jgi:hypothetical protein